MATVNFIIIIIGLIAQILSIQWLVHFYLSFFVLTIDSVYIQMHIFVTRKEKNIYVIIVFLTCGRVVWYIFRFFFFRFKRGTLSKYFLYRDSVCAQCFKMFFLLLVVRLLHLNRYDLILLTLAIALNYGLSCLILGYTYILTMVYCLKWVGLFNFVSSQEHAGILST